MLHKNQGGFTWTSSDTNIATVDNNGKVIGVSVGEVEITATNGEITIPATKVKVIQTKSENTDTTTYIYTAKDLAKFRDSVNAGNTYAGKTVQLMADIDLSTICGQKIGSWEPIATYVDTGNSFSGTFDGAYHKINNVYINTNEYIHVGLFGYIPMNAVVKNLIIKDARICNYYTHNNVSNGICTGAISGQITGKIQNCAAISSNIIGNSCTESTTYNCNICVGGICGYASGDIEQCYNNSKVSVIGKQLATSTKDVSGFSGGIVGSFVGAGTSINTTSSSIKNCYNIGEITGNVSTDTGNQTVVGGITGRIARTNLEYKVPTMENSYNIGNVKIIQGATKMLGGIAGRNGSSGSNTSYMGTITNCFCTNSIAYYTSTTASSTSGVVSGSNLKTYVSTLNNGQTDEIWILDETNINNGYPILKWQLPENR